jgi:hypothetical protein
MVDEFVETTLNSNKPQLLASNYGTFDRRTAPAAVMVDEFVETTLNSNKPQLLASNYGTFDR